MDFYFLFWIFSALVSTCYTYVWDVRMDWGLMDPNHGFLRARLLFKHLVSVVFEVVTQHFSAEVLHDDLRK